MKDRKYNVVMIDDEKDFLDAYEMQMEEEFQIHPFTEPLHAAKFLETNDADAVILDYHIPGYETLEIFSTIKSKMTERPILFLTGETRVSVKLDSLALGVADYLQKPITVPELSAYLKNRIHTYRRKRPQTIKIFNLEVDVQALHVKVDGESVALTPKEFEFLMMFVLNPNIVIRKEDIKAKMWPNTFVEQNNLDTHMSHIRKKLGSFSSKIKTIKRIGYVLRV